MNGLGGFDQSHETLETLHELVLNPFLWPWTLCLVPLSS